MRYILHLTLEGFFIRHVAQNRSGPLAVVRNGIVLDINKEARARGMSVGMEKRTARSIVHEAEYIPWQEDKYEEAQRQWLDLCIDFTGIIEPEEQNSAFLDLSGHPSPIDVSEKLIRTLAQETGLQIFYGSSCSKWIAKLASAVGDCGSAAIDPAQFLAPQPVSKLAPVSTEHRQRLNFLGYRTIGDILTIPQEILRQQFGPEGLFIAKAARGDFMDPPRAVYPKDSLIESLIFDGPVESLETVDLALKDLALRVATRLSSKSQQGQELEVSLETEDSQIHRQKRRFSKPIHNHPSALASLRLITNDLLTSSQSSALSPQPLTAIRLQMTNLKHNREKQKELIGHVHTNDASAFQHVRTVFGDSAVLLGGDIPVPRRVKVLREWKNAIGWS